MAKQASWCPAGKPRVDDLNLGGDIYFHFEFFACFPSLQIGGELASEIKHDNSSVSLQNDESYKALYTYSCNIAFSKCNSYLK